MKLTNQEIINIIQALDSLGNKELPILITYKIVDNLDRLMSVYEVYDKTRVKAKNDDEIKELLKAEREVELETLTKQDLIDSGITLTPFQLVGFRRIIDG